METLFRQREFAHLNLHKGKVCVGFRLTDGSLELNDAFVPSSRVAKHQAKVVPRCTMARFQSDRQLQFLLGTKEVIRQKERVTQIVE